MKKKVLNMGAVIIALVCIIGASWYFDHKNAKITTSQINSINLGPNEAALKPIRMINSDDIVYVEGISDEMASDINLVLRRYEETGDLKMDDDMLWVYSQLQPTIANWFNPDFNLIEAFSAKNHTLESDGKTAWLSVQLSQILASGDTDSIFYYRYDDKLGGYRMSAYYYLLGLSYSCME